MRDVEFLICARRLTREKNIRRAAHGANIAVLRWLLGRNLILNLDVGVG